MAKAAHKLSTRTNPVTLDEALALCLPGFGSASKVAAWLNLLLQMGRIFLFGDGVKMPPASCQNGMVRIVSFDSPPRLEVHVSAWCPQWTRNREDLEWTFERTGFEANLPAATKQAPRREPTGWQAVLVLRWLRAAYPPDGKVPDGKTYKELRDEMARDPRVIAELKRTGRAVPSEDTIGRVVEYLGRSD
jgi:hypothetical protein